MKKIICKVIERLFPGEVKRIKETNRARRAAIQALLDANRVFRLYGTSPERINATLGESLKMYCRGDYKNATAMAVYEMSKAD